MAETYPPCSNSFRDVHCQLPHTCPRHRTSAVRPADVFKGTRALLDGHVFGPDTKRVNCPRQKGLYVIDTRDFLNILFLGGAVILHTTVAFSCVNTCVYSCMLGKMLTVVAFFFHHNMFFNSPTHTIQEAAQLQRQQLRANVATFDAALLALENGNDQILPPIAAAQQVGNTIYIYISLEVSNHRRSEKKHHRRNT